MRFEALRFPAFHIFQFLHRDQIRPHRTPHIPFVESCTPTPFGRVFARRNEATAHPEVAVILVHGMIVSGNYMLPLAALLSPSCRVHVPDLPGYGRSDKPERILSIRELADALAMWMEGSSITKANLVANSFGCQVVADLAARYPEKVEKLVLQGPTVDAHARGFFRQLVRMRLNSGREARSVGLISARDYKKAGAKRVLRTISMTLQDRIEEKLPRIHAPTLIVRGKLDPVVPHEWAEEVVGMIPHAQFIEIEGAAHTLNYSKPDEFAAVIKSFLGL